MFGLRDTDIIIIQQILSKYPEIKEALIFGSRAKGTYHQGSDVDIVLKGNGGNKIALIVGTYLNQESLLPYYFDIINYSSIDNDALLEHIHRVGKPLYPKVKD